MHIEWQNFLRKVQTNLLWIKCFFLHFHLFLTFKYLASNEPATIDSGPTTEATEPTENVSDMAERMKFESIGGINLIISIEYFKVFSKLIYFRLFVNSHSFK